MEKTSILSLLKEIEDFKSVPESQLNWFVETGEVVKFADGDYLFKVGEEIVNFYVVIEGKFKIYTVQNGSQKIFGMMEAGSLNGQLPFSRLKNAQGSAVAVGKSAILRIHKKEFKNMGYEMTEALVHFMSSRIREFTQTQLRDEKLLSLGKLSAGLTHELNNPASAIVRSSAALKSHLKLLPDNFKKVIKIKMSDAEIDEINNILFERIEAYKPNQLSLSERNECEDKVAEWLEERGMDDGYEIAENLVEFGFIPEELDRISELLSDDDFLPIILWIENNLSTEKMVLEIEEASQRISGIIQSVKAYTHMDKDNSQQAVNVHEGLRSTLTMLKHKIKDSKVEIEENFDCEEPTFQGLPGEINQVWTNILDNAIDALAGTENPKIYIETTGDKDAVQIKITDNGMGIPQEKISKVFDPFFTTKEIGKGTGMGLNVVNQIVNKHKGDIKVKSEVGKTTFNLCFPKND